MTAEKEIEAASGDPRKEALGLKPDTLIQQKTASYHYFAYQFYKTLTTLAEPLLLLLLRLRVRQGKEDPARWREKTGLPSLPRPTGTLLWFHAASVGESKAVLPLIRQYLTKHPERSALITTGTRTAAAQLSGQLPPRAVHQFAPLDNPRWLRRFLAHWQPNALVLVESELWPNMLQQTAKRAPVALINARMSPRSQRRWGKFSGLARRVFAPISMFTAQDSSSAAFLRGLTSRPVTLTGNLKFDAAPLPVEEAALTLLLQQLGSRPVWLAASTHPGEESILVKAHTRIRDSYPDALLIIVPRHPKRGAALAAQHTGSGLRSRGDAPAPDSPVYIADTLGELGLWYRAVPLAFIGGSLIPHGGQNLFEPAQLGCALLTGAHLFNFLELAAHLEAHEALTRASDAGAISAAVLQLFDNPPLLQQQQQNAQMAAKKLQGGINATLRVVEGLT